MSLLIPSLFLLFSLSLSPSSYLYECFIALYASTMRSVFDTMLSGHRAIGVDDNNDDYYHEGDILWDTVEAWYNHVHV